MTIERWTDETLDRFASTVSTSIAASNEGMTRIDEHLERMAITVRLLICLNLRICIFLGAL
jgi:hypothetical protein